MNFGVDKCVMCDRQGQTAFLLPCLHSLCDACVKSTRAACTAKQPQVLKCCICSDIVTPAQMTNMLAGAQIAGPAVACAPAEGLRISKRRRSDVAQPPQPFAFLAAEQFDVAAADEALVALGRVKTAFAALDEELTALCAELEQNKSDLLVEIEQCAALADGSPQHEAELRNEAIMRVHADIKLCEIQQDEVRCFVLRVGQTECLVMRAQSALRRLPVSAWPAAHGNILRALLARCATLLRVETRDLRPRVTLAHFLARPGIAIDHFPYFSIESRPRYRRNRLDFLGARRTLPCVFRIDGFRNLTASGWNALGEDALFTNDDTYGVSVWALEDGRRTCVHKKRAIKVCASTRGDLWVLYDASGSGTATPQLSVYGADGALLRADASPLPNWDFIAKTGIARIDAFVLSPHGILVVAQAGDDSRVAAVAPDGAALWCQVCSGPFAGGLVMLEPMLVAWFEYAGERVRRVTLNAHVGIPAAAPQWAGEVLPGKHARIARCEPGGCCVAERLTEQDARLADALRAPQFDGGAIFNRANKRVRHFRGGLVGVSVRASDDAPASDDSAETARDSPTLKTLVFVQT